jgi:hypothetical protein
MNYINVVTLQTYKTGTTVAPKTMITQVLFCIVVLIKLEYIYVPSITFKLTSWISVEEIFIVIIMVH